MRLCLRGRIGVPPLVIYVPTFLPQQGQYTCSPFGFSGSVCFSRSGFNCPPISTERRQWLGTRDRSGVCFGVTLTDAAVQRRSLGRRQGMVAGRAERHLGRLALSAAADGSAKFLNQFQVGHASCPRITRPGCPTVVAALFRSVFRSGYVSARTALLLGQMFHSRSIGTSPAPAPECRASRSALHIAASHAVFCSWRGQSMGSRSNQHFCTSTLALQSEHFGSGCAARISGRISAMVTWSSLFSKPAPSIS